jgi:phosphatidylserine decarboxylase
VSNYPHPVIAREGWPFVAIAAFVTIVLLATGWWFLAALAFAVLIFILQFFRDPPRVVPQQPNAVLSPADGKIVMVGPARDPYLDRDSIKISVFMNVFNVHSNRIPVDGVVVNAWYHPGSFVNAALDKASLDNERNALHLRTSGGQDVTCVQIAGLIARRILCYVKQGDTVTRGQRYGFIRFGSRVDVYLPPLSVPRSPWAMSWRRPPLSGCGSANRPTSTRNARCKDPHSAASPVAEPLHHRCAFRQVYRSCGDEPRFDRRRSLFSWRWCSWSMGAWRASPEPKVRLAPSDSLSDGVVRRGTGADCLQWALKGMGSSAGSRPSFMWPARRCGSRASIRCWTWPISAGSPGCRAPLRRRWSRGWCGSSMIMASIRRA